jgi:hypothetical protein
MELTPAGATQPLVVVVFQLLEMNLTTQKLPTLSTDTMVEDAFVTS